MRVTANERDVTIQQLKHEVESLQRQLQESQEYSKLEKGQIIASLRQENQDLRYENAEQRAKIGQLVKTVSIAFKECHLSFRKYQTRDSSMNELEKGEIKIYADENMIGRSLGQNDDDQDAGSGSEYSTDFF